MIDTIVKTPPISGARRAGCGPNPQPEGFYPTPAAVTRALLSVESFTGLTWEPACGDGAMSKVLIDAGLNVESTDIVPRGYGTELDFLGPDVMACTVDNVITNPPYGVGRWDTILMEFMERALAVSTRKVALFLKLNHVGSHDRAVFYRDSPLRTVYVLEPRVTLYRDGIKGPDDNTGTWDYVWAVWDHSWFGKTELAWLDWNPFK